MILRVHYNFNLDEGGGAEYHILKLMDAFKIHGGDSWKNYLLLIDKGSDCIRVKLHHEDKDKVIDTVTELNLYLNNLIKKLSVKIIHVHTIPWPSITKILLDVGLPVFRSMHEPMIICPGWSKYWLSQDKPCEVSFGLPCLLNAYTKKCTRSRNPIKLLKSYNNVNFEMNEAIHKYEAIFACSDYIIEEAIKTNVSKNKIVKVPSPQYDPYNWTHDKKLDDGKIVIVFSGRLSKQKGCRFLIRAILKLKNDGLDNFKVLIFGKGPDEPFLRKMVKQLGLDNLITFYGWVDRKVLVEHYKNAHISVIPSTYPDTFPNSVAEAMLARLVVVAFNSGGTCEWFDDMKSGVKVENKNLEALYKAIKNLIVNKELVTKIGIEARSKVLSTHTMENTFKEYEKTYSRGLNIITK